MSRIGRVLGMLFVVMPLAALTFAWAVIAAGVEIVREELRS